MGSIISGASAHGRTHDHSNPSDGTILLPGGLLPGSNLVTNGSFESGFLGWTLSAGPPYLAGGLFGNVPDGKWCVGFHPGLGYQYVVHGAPLLAPFLAGHWYCASYATLIDAGSISATGTGLVMEGTDAVPGTINSDAGLVGGTVPFRLATGNVAQLTWVRRWVSWQQNTSQADRYVVLTDGYGGGHTGGEVYIDAAQVTEGASPSNYVAGDDGIPSGVIVMWSGETSTIPYGWVLCDGTLGTPDLRDRFIIGADATNENTSGGTVSASAALATHAGHSNHVVTQPTAHGNHVFTQPSAHGTHATHVMSGSTASTTAGPAYTTGSGNSPNLSTHVHGIGSVAADAHGAHTNNHAGGAVDAHTNNHAGSAVDAHSAHDGHAIEKFYRLAFIMKA